MLKTLSITIAFGATVALSGAAAAQDLEPETLYEFDDDDVQGEYRSPLGEIVHVRRGAGRVSLIRPRVHYVPEMLESVEDL